MVPAELRPMNLEQKQKYYDYGGQYYYRQPPRLDNAIHRALRDIDSDYRLIWAGVAVIRKNPDDERPFIRDDERATKINVGRIVPKYLEIKIQQAKALCYRHKKGHVVRVQREDQAPKGKVTWWESTFIEYGKLRWMLERYWTSEQLVAAGLYHSADVTLPTPGDWRWCLTVETPEHLYFEPTREWMAMVRDHVYEMNNMSLSELRIIDTAASERREQLRNERAMNDLDDFLAKRVPGYTPPDPRYLLSR